MAHVTVYQINSEGKKSYMNVNENHGDVEVWTNTHKNYTLLCFHNLNVSLIQFDSEEFYLEFIKDDTLEYDRVVRLMDGKIVDVVFPYKEEIE
jgi:hypothetical protein